MWELGDNERNSRKQDELGSLVPLVPGHLGAILGILATLRRCEGGVA